MIADAEVSIPPDGDNQPISILIRRYEQVVANRRIWEYHWQELRDLVNPHGSDFNRFTQPGARKTDLIFEGTACGALEELAAGLHSFMTSPTDRWFNLAVHGYDHTKDYLAMTWLEQVADIIYSCYSEPRTNTNDALHESYMDLGSFGTACIYQDWDRKENHLFFKTYPLADVRILENANGYVDSVWRDVQMSTRQIRETWPDIAESNRAIKEERNEERFWKVVHCVFPRTDRSAQKLNAKNKKYASYYFCAELKQVFSESGYDEFPYHVPRWAKRAGEMYGRSPGMTCLPDIKMLQAMEKVQIKSMQKLVDPPLLVPNDGFMLPIETKPSSLIFYDNGTGDNNMIRPLETKAQVQVGEDKMEQKRQYIRKCFYADWLQRMKKTERQTATEIMDDRQEMMQMMAPILGRLQSELTGPMIARTYNLLNARGMIPPAPYSLQRRKIKIVYISPVAIAQLAIKGTVIKAFVEEMMGMAQAMPEVIDSLDPDGIAKTLSIVQNVPRGVLRNPDEVKKIRAQRQKQQQAAMAAQTAEPASAAAKNLATAQEKGLDLSQVGSMGAAGAAGEGQAVQGGGGRAAGFD